MRIEMNLDSMLIAISAPYKSLSIAVWPDGLPNGTVFTVYLHADILGNKCAHGDGTTLAAALAEAVREFKQLTNDQGRLPEPCGYCGATSLAEVEFLCQAGCAQRTPAAKEERL